MSDHPFEGPFGYANWRAFLRGAPATHGGEAALYSDARFTGQLSEGLGPYQVLHTFPLSPPGTLAPVFALRANDHISPERGSKLTTELFRKERTILDHYHGGSNYDEIAALLSLSVGVRLKAGPVTRRFDDRGDPRGRLVDPDIPTPVFSVGQRKSAVPGLVGERDVQAELLPTYSVLSPADALALIRAARSYQEAMWVADSDPQLSWLLLVSAVETAAARWYRATKTTEGTDSEVLRAAKPDLASVLHEAGGHALVAKVAEVIAQGMRAGHRFREFLVTFAPPPPEPRPNEWGSLDWGPKGLRKALIAVYNHRSKALHESIPFPVPLCSPPMTFTEEGRTWRTETPGGGAMFADGGVWQLAELPMLLWVFEYLTRNALLNWWASAVPAPAPSSQTTPGDER